MSRLLPMSMKKLALVCTLVAPLFLFAQKRNNNWVFGQRSWITFNGPIPDTLPLSYRPSWRNASMSDTAGNFLMMVDDHGIHNGLFGLMPNGSASSLGYSADQSNYLILPKPGAPDNYTVLVNQREDQKRAGWFEVDM